MGDAPEVAERREGWAELSRSSEELHQLNEELKRFTYVASHDLQEPLRKIMQYVDRMAASDVVRGDPSAVECLARVRSASGRMSALIQSLFDYARILTQAAPIERVALGTCVDEVLSDLEGVLSRSGGRVEVGPLPVVRADPVHMRQIFQNLIGNALKFRAKDRAPQVRVAEAATRRGFVAVEVADNGIGFDIAYAERIFKPFQRLHGRGQYEGAGLGLAICDRIAVRYGGEIGVRSVPGVGSCFTVVLPAP